MAKRIDLPPDFGDATITKVLLQELEPQRVLIDDGAVVRPGFVVHTPAGGGAKEEMGG